MAEEQAGIGSTVRNWVKAGVTSVVGLVSGAFLMCLTPVINKEIKPALPLANFASQVSGQSVTFQDHSAGGASGWWDFGDGTALEPYVPNQASITHPYDKAGSYSVKLALQNVIGDENDRTVTINIDGTGSTKPEITLFEVVPITPEGSTPAVYQVKTIVKNATYCLLSTGDSRPMQLDVDVQQQERYLTYQDMGTYTIRFAAVNGKEIVEKTKTIQVSAANKQDLMAKLSMAYQAVKVERASHTFHVPCVWQESGSQGTSSFAVDRAVTHGFKIVSAELVNKDDKDAPVRNIKLEVAADKTRFRVSGELVKPMAWGQPVTAPSWRAEVKVALERRSARVLVNRGDVSMAAAMNSTIHIPMQPMEDGWQVTATQMHLELWDGDHKVWESSQPVANASTTLKNQACNVSLTPEKSSMRLTITSASMPLTPAAPVSFVPPTSDEPPLASPPTTLIAPPVSPVAPIVPAVGPDTAAPTAPIVPLVARPAAFERLPLLPRPKEN